jgi:hypothetical protein
MQPNEKLSETELPFLTWWAWSLAIWTKKKKETKEAGKWRLHFFASFDSITRRSLSCQSSLDLNNEDFTFVSFDSITTSSSCQRSLDLNVYLTYTRTTLEWLSNEFVKFYWWSLSLRIMLRFQLSSMSHIYIIFNFFIKKFKYFLLIFFLLFFPCHYL